ncbi:hypothetical protein E1A91_A04G153900v1 [Gossypium mustelinum]|uniref:Uncharacterized protein n=2 Tax=Gossypium TaxID=3633 RepID=A0A5D2ZNX6_GOSMU|nr:hypothetical protein E1A91_A04G153900v1 [Gossypium mustelinum]
MKLRKRKKKKKIAAAEGAKSFATMLVKRLEICIELLKFAIKFVIAQVEKVINESLRHRRPPPPVAMRMRSLSPPLPFLGPF